MMIMTFQDFSPISYLQSVLTNIRIYRMKLDLFISGQFVHKIHNNDSSVGYQTIFRIKTQENSKIRTRFRVSNANQSPVPIGSKPIERHFQRPTPNVNKLHRIYTIF